MNPTFMNIDDDKPDPVVSRIAPYVSIYWVLVAILMTAMHIDIMLLVCVCCAFPHPNIIIINIGEEKEV